MIPIRTVDELALLLEVKAKWSLALRNHMTAQQLLEFWRISIVWNDRPTSRLGLCVSSSQGKVVRIEIHPCLMDQPGELLDTLAHEAAHACCTLTRPGTNQGHNLVWKSWARILGARPQRTARVPQFEEVRQKRMNYAARCAKCDVTIYRQRAPKPGGTYRHATCKTAVEWTKLDKNRILG